MWEVCIPVTITVFARRLLLISAIAIMFPSFCRSQDPVTAPRLPSRPVIDGVLDDAYRQGAQLVDFWDFSRSIGKPVPAAKPVRVWLGHANDTLFVFCQADEPETTRIQALARPHDGPIWNDDCIELFIDPSGQRKSYYQFGLSACGSTADLFEGSASWDAPYESAARIGDGKWCAEWAIPFASLGATRFENLDAAKFWTFNICREDKVSNTLSTWTPMDSSVCQSFGVPAVFAGLQIVPDPKPGVFSLRGQRLRRAQPGKTPIVWETADPLFEPLLSSEPRRIPHHTGMFWTHPLGMDAIRSSAVQYALAYSRNETGNVFKQVDFHPIQSEDTLSSTLNASVNMERYPQAGGMCLANAAFARGEGMPAAGEGGRTILLTEKNRAAYLKGVEEILAKHGNQFFGLFFGDEVVESQREMIVSVFSKNADKHPYIQDIDKQVKASFGLGLYGIPKSEDDPEPYRWIALERWMDDRVCALLGDVRALVDRLAPKVVLVSDDPIAGFQAYDFSRRGKICDVITHQTYPAKSANRQEVGFITKVIADLSGKSVWPCVHAENYGACYTPAETAEVYSQAFRCGAEGIHYYPDDVMGTRRNLLDTHYCGLGAPDRWATMLSIYQKVHELPRLRLPANTATAVLIEPSTFQALVPDERLKHQEYECCFTFLGPAARSWFRFVHASQFERGDLKPADFKVIYLPMGTFAAPAAAESLVEFARSGGVVVSADPTVFRYSTAAAYEPLAARAELGWQCDEASTPQHALRITDNALFPALAKGQVIGLGAGVTGMKPKVAGPWSTLAEFEDGSPAILSREIGKGRWIQFAWQPFTVGLIGNEQLRALFKSLQEKCGEATGLDIWRFTFPTAPVPPAPTGRCLTGNAVLWTQNVPQPIGGDGLNGQVRWSMRPEETTSSVQEFTQTKLCDRRKATRAENDRTLYEARRKWTCVWTDRGAFDLDVVLPQAGKLQALKLWHCGQLPATTISVRKDAGEWSLVGSMPAKQAGEDVVLSELPLKEASAKEVRLHFAERAAGDPMVLSELELWAP